MSACSNPYMPRLISIITCPLWLIEVRRYYFIILSGILVSGIQAYLYSFSGVPRKKYLISITSYLAPFMLLCTFICTLPTGVYKFWTKFPFLSSVCRIPCVSPSLQSIEIIFNFPLSSNTVHKKVYNIREGWDSKPSYTQNLGWLALINK